MVGKSKNAVDTWSKTFSLVQSQELELVVAPVSYWVDTHFIFEEFSFEMCWTIIQSYVIFFQFLGCVTALS